MLMLMLHNLMLLNVGEIEGTHIDSVLQLHAIHTVLTLRRKIEIKERNTAVSIFSYVI